MKLKITFSPEEVNEHSELQGDPPRLKFKKSSGKVGFSFLLIDKIADALKLEDAKFTVAASLKPAHVSSVRMYIKCTHSKTHPAEYDAEKFARDSALEWSVEWKCPECEKNHKDPAPTVVTPTPAAPPASVPIEQVFAIPPAPLVNPTVAPIAPQPGPSFTISMIGHSEVDEFFSDTASEIEKAMQKYRNFCAGTDNPLATLARNKQKFANGLSKLFMEGMTNVEVEVSASESEDSDDDRTTRPSKGSQGRASDVFNSPNLKRPRKQTQAELAVARQASLLGKRQYPPITSTPIRLRTRKGRKEPRTTIVHEEDDYDFNDE